MSDPLAILTGIVAICWLLLAAWVVMNYFAKKSEDESNGEN